MLDLHSSSIDVITDWLEVTALAINPVPLSRNRAVQLGETIANLTEHQVEQGFHRMGTRGHQIGEFYPFKVTHEYVLADANKLSSAYATMLAVTPGSALRSVQAWKMDYSAKIFELAAEHCLSKFYGAGTNAVNFGHPSSVGRPAEFGQAVQWIAEKMGVKLGSGYRDPRRKDGGVDIFVWKAFADSNPGVPLLLVQCTIQDNFLTKISDIDTRLWASWLSSDIDPMVALCVPNYVTRRQDWDEITTRGLLLDRQRLCQLEESLFALSGPQEAYIKQMYSQYADWCK